MALRALLDRLAGRRWIDDPVYGRMRLERKAWLWEGSVDFAPAGSNVDVLVEAGEAGPSDAQRQFLARLAERYPELDAEVQRMAAGRGEEDGEWLLVVIDVRHDALERGRCELTYEQGIDLLSIDVDGWRPRILDIGEA